MKGITVKDRNDIDLYLDSYEDIFSDFDPRTYSQKALSEDFSSELMKASRDKEDGRVHVILLVPKHKRAKKDEELILKRLKDHFIKHWHFHQKDKKKTVFQGLLFVFFGIITMLLATMVLFTLEEGSMLSSFLIVLLEPAGWFLFWEGLNITVFESRKINPELDFYSKMAKAKIEFGDLKCR